MASIYGGDNEAETSEEFDFEKYCDFGKTKKQDDFKKLMKELTAQNQPISSPFVEGFG